MSDEQWLNMPHLPSLVIKNFRCLEDLTIQKLGHVNLIVGANNSGKSTILEAIRIYGINPPNAVLFSNLLAIRDEFLASASQKVDSVGLEETHPSKSFFSNRTIEKDKKIQIGEINNLQNCVTIEGIFGISGDFYHNLEVVNTSLKWGKRISKIALSNLAVRSPSRRIDSMFEYKDGYVSSQLPSAEELMVLFAKVIREYGDNKILIDALKIIEPRISNVFFDPIDQICFVKHQDFQKTIPLKTLGEGMMRILQLALFIPRAQETGFLLIDEFENGLYWRTQSKIWEFLFEIAKRYNIQIFATTHSKDTIKSFAKIALARKDMEGVLISLDRSAAKKDNNKIIAIEYDEESLVHVIEDDIEVR